MVVRLDESTVHPLEASFGAIKLVVFKGLEFIFSLVLNKMKILAFCFILSDFRIPK